ncbi:hypothetical protein [Pseudomonas sp. GL-R-26]|uniref:hypothetical protein n=1 Tax=Pseudomonas sp. GL-R-26 TaxID=2832392 RepID=UPI001CBE27C6|nr:hypothetical protein [Pseudomonas sp. GL-R-26]
MASQDSKQSLAAWSQRVPGRNGPLAFDEPDVSTVTMPGNPPGLFPRASLDAGIGLEIKAWATLPTDDGETESVILQIARPGSDEYEDVATVTYTHGTSTFPLPITLPAAFLLKPENEGAFNIRYEHVNWVGTSAWSVDVPVFIDKTPPNGTAAPDKITFSIAPPFTEDKLAGLTDVDGTIPVWAGAAQGDRVAFAWMKDRLPEDPNDIVPIAVVELGPDRKVKFPVALIRSLGDGGFCGGYTIFDKAGNRSRISLYDLIPVALGTLPPTPYPAPSVPEAVPKGYVDRNDALQGVHVEFASILHAKSTDEVEIIWNGVALDYKTPVGSSPGNTISIGVSWVHMRDQYGAATGAVSTPIEYKLYRGILELGGASGTVMVNFETTGPGNPDPWPGNPLLLPLDVFGKSNVANKLVASDEDELIEAVIELVDPIADGDKYQVLWNGVPIGAPYVINIANDTAGDEIRIELDWDVIRRQGNNPKMPVTYSLSNPAIANPQEPKDPTEVGIEFLTVNLPVAQPQHLINGRLTCRSLHTEGGKMGFQYLIPASDYLKEGMMVSVEWKAYTTYANPQPVPGAGKTATLGPVTAEQEANGLMWLIEPYDTHLLPTWGGPTDQEGKGEVIYTLVVDSVPVPSPASDTRVVLSAGSGTCVIP